MRILGTIAFRCTVVALLPCLVANADTIVDFDDLTLAPNSYWRGPDPNGEIVDGPYGLLNVGKFVSHGTSFVNKSDLTYGSWSGFAYSNMADTTTPGFMNQFSAYTGTGNGPGQDNYGVAFGYDDIAPNLFDPDPFDPTDAEDLKALPTFVLPVGPQIASMYVTNTTYAALSMLQGDSFAKVFGGPTGDDPDWFKLSVFGTDAAGNALSDSVEFYLADYRFEDNSLDYIISDWTFLDLSSLSGATALHFNLSSSDVGLFGLNTPAYFAVDDIRLVNSIPIPEPSSMALASMGVVAFGLIARRRRAAGS